MGSLVDDRVNCRIYRHHVGVQHIMENSGPIAHLSFIVEYIVPIFYLYVTFDLQGNAEHIYGLVEQSLKSLFEAAVVILHVNL